jgi:hypothetical protein
MRHQIRDMGRVIVMVTRYVCACAQLSTPPHMPRTQYTSPDFQVVADLCFKPKDSNASFNPDGMYAYVHASRVSMRDFFLVFTQLACVSERMHA